MTSKPQESQKNILGYTLQERIGSGGFGEVWSAIAPGGLMKAVKIVYGFHDEKRAQAELKALDRVKSLRHPFLLSLERIEIFDGQLVVVTELADNCLADVFNEFAFKGEAGIPRENLIKYMRGVADALDYLSDEHNLQHLDIKPENLLLVSGHVKVADFGLIKDLENASQSLMSGMTPAYAAPELFDGRPGTKSDQYSLAIVYQEMLTGERPFPGNTPAQLAAQHMHGKPNLRPLPKSDQPIIAKALSKDPSVRFKSCRDMVEELSNKKRSIKKAIRRTQPIQTDSEDKSKTFLFPESHSNREVTAVISGMALPFQAAELKSLDPPECTESNATVRPTLVVTVGSTANRIAQRIKKQIVCRHGSMDNVPSLRILSVDTDRQSLGELRTGTGPGALNGDEIIETPLRKPEVYRERSQSHLSWLSRRWIYNVPRSLQTEGLRPLGRLAFADHFEPICDRIQAALKQIVAEEHLAKSSDTLEMDPGELKPRVFIVTSISGGTGSGMVLDLAYTIKLLMQENGLVSDEVMGVLLHSNYQRTRDPGLSAANAFAFLTELRHFVENGFPGDDSVGLPEFDGEPPFDFTYFNELGNDLSQSEYEEKLDKVAEYIYLSTTSKCSEFFDQCRKMEVEIDHFALRTFGISSTGPGNLIMGENAVNQVGRGLIRRWISGDSNLDFDATSFVDTEFAKLSLGPDQVVVKIDKSARGILIDKLDSIITSANDIVLSGSEHRLSNLTEFMDGIFGCPPSRRDSSHHDPEICGELEKLVVKEANAVGSGLAAVILEMISGNELSLQKPRRTVETCRARIDGIRRQLEQAATQCESELQLRLSNLGQFSSEKIRGKVEEKARFDTAIGFYCLARLQEFVTRYAKVYFRVIANTVDGSHRIIARFQNQLESVAEQFDSTDQIEDSGSLGEFSMDRLLSDSIEQAIEQHILKTELQVYESLVKERGGYLEVLSEASVIQNQLPVEIRLAAQRVLADAYKKVSLENVVVKNHVAPEQLVRWLSDRIREACPQVDDCGGATRLMLGIPALSGDSILPSILEKQFNAKSCMIKGTQGNFVICFESEDIALANVAFRLLEARPDAIELVKRIHTRNDIEWSTLDDLL